MRKEITRIDVISVGTMLGFIYMGIGIIVGILFAIIGGMLANMEVGEGASMLFGMGFAGIIIFPLIYGAIGFIAGVLTAFIYNVVAGWVGGIKVDIENLDLT